MKESKIYDFCPILTIFGLAGVAENITSGRGSIIISFIIFIIGLAIVLDDYISRW